MPTTTLRSALFSMLDMVSLPVDPAAIVMEAVEAVEESSY